MNDPDDMRATIEAQRIRLERQDEYIRTLEATVEGKTDSGLWVITQRRFENALMLMTCAAVVALLVVAVRYAGADVLGWSMWFGVTLLCGVVAVGVYYLVRRMKR